MPIFSGSTERDRSAPICTWTAPASTASRWRPCLLERSGLTLEDIDWIVPHQANRRIIDTAAKRLGAPVDRFYQNMERYGNTSAASIPIALDEMAEQGLLRRGQKIICAAFGAGLTWGGVLFEW